jgi:phosphohistidine phosphatase
MLKLYLIRHGKYIPMDVNMTCPLSQEGEDEISRLARFFSESELKVSHIFHSSKVRARQTAEILAAVLNDCQCGFHEGLEPNDPVIPIISTIQSFSEDVMLVGHLPFMDILINELLAVEERLSLIDFHPGTIVCLLNENDQWKISWVLTPAVCPK